MKSVRLFVVAVLLCALSLAPALLAQSGRGTITGIVRDASGAVVPGVEIAITNKVTGLESMAVTTDGGVYRAPYVTPGTYRLSASLPGFKTAVADNVDVLVAQTVTVDFTLEVGEVSEQVEVLAKAPLLETSTPEIGVNVTEKEVHTWPILVGDGTRQLQQFIFTSLPGTQGGTFRGAINGGQTYSHEILFDGITIGRMDLNGGSNNEFTPTIEAVSEVKLQTGALSSQYGYTQTAVVNFGLKSGTNEFHGSAFWFHQNRVLNANSWGDNRFGRKKPPILQNNFGFTVGGPIIKDRTHFFFSYEGERLADGRTSGTLSLPVGPFKQGDFSLLLDPKFTGDSKSGTVVGTDALGRPVVFGQIYDPSTSRQLPNGTWVRDPFPGNIIRKDQFSRTTLAALQHDIPNPALFQFSDNHPRAGTCCPVLNVDNFSIKIDHVINDNHKVAASYVSNDRGRKRFGSGPNMVGVPIPGPAMRGDRFQDTPGHMGRFAEDWTISNTMLNHFAFGYNLFHNRNQSNAFLSGKDWAKELGLQNVGTRTFPQINLGANNATLGSRYPTLGDGGTSDAPSGSAGFLDDFTWLRGNHSLRFGFEHRRYYRNNRSFFGSGSYTFHNENTALPGFANFTGFNYASFLIGAVRNAGLGIPLVTTGVRARTTSFYFHDDWKMNANLTVNFGLRWDIPTPLTEAANRMSGLNPTLANPGVDGFRGAMEMLGDCQGCSGRDAFTGIYWKQFGPRLGFAWTNEGRNIVVRGGYGINFSPPIMDGFNFPYSEGFNGSNPIIARSGRFTEDPSYNWDNPYPAFTQKLPNPNPALLNRLPIGFYPPETNKWPYVQNWNLGVQFELPWETKLETNYVGNKGTRLNVGQYEGSLNQLDPKHLALGDKLLDNISKHPDIAKPYPSFNGTVARALRPFPQYESISTYRLNNGWSAYHSLQITGIKRSTHGLSFLAAYTFSKALGTGDSVGISDYSPGQNFYDIGSDYAVVDFNIPHDFKLTWIYDLPFGKQARWLTSGPASSILGGWTLSAIQRYRSGNPISIGTGGFDPQALFSVGIRPDVLLPRDQQTLGKKPDDVNPVTGTPYLNPAAFGSPPKTGKNVPLRLGNAPRFLPDLRGFAIFGEDFSLVKRTPLPFREDATFEIRLDAANIFNRIGMGGPVTSVTDTVRFGKIFSKGGGPRTLQLALRVVF